MPHTWLEFVLGGLISSTVIAGGLTWIAAISLVLAAWKQRSSLMKMWRPYHWLFLTHALFLAAAGVVGALYPAPLPHPEYWHPNRTAELYLQGLEYASLASCAFWIWRMRGFRWFATSLMVLLECALGGVLFVAGMAVTGDWI